MASGAGVMAEQECDAIGTRRDGCEVCPRNPLQPPAPRAEGASRRSGPWTHLTHNTGQRWPLQTPQTSSLGATGRRWPRPRTPRHTPAAHPTCGHWHTDSHSSIQATPRQAKPGAIARYTRIAQCQEAAQFRDQHPHGPPESAHAAAQQSTPPPHRGCMNTAKVSRVSWEPPDPGSGPTTQCGVAVNRPPLSTWAASPSWKARHSGGMPTRTTCP